MSRLDPPTVLLDASFVAALTNHDEPFHADAVATYAELIDRYERAEVLLGATSDTLEPLTPAIRASLFSPVTTVRIAEQHRNAALDVAGPSAADPDLATLLVILRREKIRCVASFDRRLDRFDIEIVPHHDLHHEPTADRRHDPTEDPVAGSVDDPVASDAPGAGAPPDRPEAARDDTGPSADRPEAPQ